MNQRIFVRIKDLNYKRYVEKSMTNHIVADSALLPEQVEMFRINPLAFLTLSESEPSTPPEAA